MFLYLFFLAYESKMKKYLLFFLTLFLLLGSVSFIYSEPLLDKGDSFDVQLIVEPTLINDPIVIYADYSFSGGKTIYYKEEVPITVDYDEGTYSVYGEEYPIIVDGATWDEVKISLAGGSAFNYYSYGSFDAFVDTSLNQSAVLDYLDKLEPRIVEMESQTGWSSELFHNGKKLVIKIFNSGNS